MQKWSKLAVAWLLWPSRIKRQYLLVSPVLVWEVVCFSSSSIYSNYNSNPLMTSRLNGFSMTISSLWSTDNLCSWCHAHLKATLIHVIDALIYHISEQCHDLVTWRVDKDICHVNTGGVSSSSSLLMLIILVVSYLDCKWE